MKTVVLFPGQGAQYCGMGKEFYEAFVHCRRRFEEAEDLLKMPLTSIIFAEDEAQLKETKISQPAIFLVSYTLWEVLQEEFGVVADAVAGLSLGEYTALTAAGVFSFEEAIKLVALRGQLMHHACEAHPGTMGVVMGLEDRVVEEVVKGLHLPDQLWVANYNCPGQVVISGTIPAVEKAAEALKTAGAKRVLPLQVHGAFHSGLMRSAQEELTPYIYQTKFAPAKAHIAMNVPGDIVDDLIRMKEFLVAQVTSSVRWHASIASLGAVDRFIEVGPGKTLTGMNKRIGVSGVNYSVEYLSDLNQIKRN